MPTPIQTYKSRITYAGDGSTTLWPFTFPNGYIDPAHINVDVLVGETVIRTEQATLIGAGTVQLLPAAAEGELVRIRRVTPTTVLVDFTNRLELTEEALDVAVRQPLLVLEEVIDAGRVEVVTTAVDLPDQTNQNGKVLGTTGTSPEWVDLPTGLPAQAGQAGKVLSTNGSVATWVTPATGGTGTGPTPPPVILGGVSPYIVGTVENFPGLDPTGVSQSTDGLRALVAAAQATGAIAFLPAGLYRVSAVDGPALAPDPHKPFELHGAAWDAALNTFGTTIICEGPHNLWQFLNVGNGGYGVHTDTRLRLVNLRMYGDGAPDRYGLSIGNLATNDVQVAGNFPYGTWSAHTGNGVFNYNCPGVRMDACFVAGFRECGYRSIHAFSTRLTDCFFVANTRRGVWHQFAANAVSTTGCKAFGNGRRFSPQLEANISFTGSAQFPAFAPEVDGGTDVSYGGMSSFYYFEMSPTAPVTRRIESVVFNSGGTTGTVNFNASAAGTLAASGLVAGTVFSFPMAQSHEMLTAPFPYTVTGVTATSITFTVNGSVSSDFALAFPTGRTFTGATDPLLQIRPAVIGLVLVAVRGMHLSGFYCEQSTTAACYIGGNTKSVRFSGGFLLYCSAAIDTATEVEVDAVACQGFGAGVWSVTNYGVRLGRNNSYVENAGSRLGITTGVRRQSATSPAAVDMDIIPEAGTYTPTLRDVGGWSNNAAVAPLAPFIWTRTGNIITVTGVVGGAAASDLTNAEFTVPFPFPADVGPYPATVTGSGFGNKTDVYGVHPLQVLLIHEQVAGPGAYVNQVAGNTQTSTEWYVNFTYKAIV